MFTLFKLFFNNYFSDDKYMEYLIYFCNQYNKVYQKMEDNSIDECCNVDKSDFQALQDTLYVIGGKWRMQILYSVCSGNKRFREIERSIPGITTRMLSKELKIMETNKLINRTVYPTTPVTVEYTITDYSESLYEVIESMINWGKEHRERIKGV